MSMAMPAPTEAASPHGDHCSKTSCARVARLEVRPGLPPGWHVAGGVLSKDGPVDDLVTKQRFGDFELELEWKIGKGGNSGVFYRGTREYDHIYWSGPEYQLLDDANAEDGKNRLTAAGAAYALYGAPAGVVLPFDHWNKHAPRRERQPCRALAQWARGRRIRVPERRLEGKGRRQ